jgi:hypothetical protein
MSARDVFSYDSQHVSGTTSPVPRVEQLIRTLVDGLEKGYYPTYPT